MEQENPIVDIAFSMPITQSEQEEFEAIKKLVFADKYLPSGYRQSSGETPRIIDNIKRYVVSPAKIIPHDCQVKTFWTEEMAADLEKNYQKVKIAQFAVKWNIPIYVVKYKLALLGLRKNKPNLSSGSGIRVKWTEEMVDKLQELYPSTPNEELATLFGISSRTIERKAVKLGFTKNEGVNKY